MTTYPNHLSHFTCLKLPSRSLNCIKSKSAKINNVLRNDMQIFNYKWWNCHVILVCITANLCFSRVYKERNLSPPKSIVKIKIKTILRVDNPQKLLLLFCSVLLISFDSFLTQWTLLKYVQNDHLNGPLNKDYLPFIHLNVPKHLPL